MNIERYENIINNFDETCVEGVYDYIIENAKKYYIDNDFISENINDYVDDIKSENLGIVELENGEMIDIYEQHIEFTESGKIPNVIFWYSIYYYKSAYDLLICNYYDFKKFI